MNIISEMDGLGEAAEYFKRFSELSARAARLAINDVAQRGGMRLAQQHILDDIEFPKGYLTGDRLKVTKFAKENDLEAVITARKRATSLARFASGQPLGSAARTGVRVKVKNGKTEMLRNAWLVRLRRGASKTEDNYNVGLALRLRAGDKVTGKWSTHKSWLVKDSIALLYGPSVDQIFLDVADEIAAPIGQMVATQFFRQFERLA